MYIVLLFGIVHGSLIGDDFENIWLMVIFDSLFVASMASFVLKRYRNYQARNPDTESRVNTGTNHRKSSTYNVTDLHYSTVQPLSKGGGISPREH